MATGDFIKILQEVRGTGVPEVTPTDGMYWDLTIALTGTNNAAGKYGHMLEMYDELGAPGGSYDDFITKYDDFLLKYADVLVQVGLATDAADAAALAQGLAETAQGLSEDARDLAETHSTNVTTRLDTVQLNGDTVEDNLNAVANDSINIGKVAAIATEVATTAGLEAELITVELKKDDITIVADDMDSVVTVSDDIPSVITTATNIASVSKVAGVRDEILVITAEPMHTSVLNAESNADSAEQDRWHAQAHSLTADSYASEPLGVLVKRWSSVGDGTFNYIDTAEYSALHYSQLLNADNLQVIQEKGVADGYAPLDSNALVPAVHLPSYVDDVIEIATYANLPVTGEGNKIYIVVADEVQGGDTSSYRWTGTVYALVSNTLTAADVKSLYESNANTNEFNDAEKVKVGNIAVTQPVNLDTIESDTILNNAKETNVTTNLSKTETEIDVTINSSDGDNVSISAANTVTAGIMTKSMYDDHILNNAKETNVTTNLGYTPSATDGIVTSSDGTNATIPLVIASGNAGLQTGSDKTRLDGIEDNATADQTASEIETLYEGIADTNKYTDVEKVIVSTANIVDNFFNGSTVDEVAGYISSDGVTITATIEKLGTGDIRYMSSTGIKTLYCTPAVTVSLVGGSDTSPTMNWIYIDVLTNLVVANQVGFPATEYVPLATTILSSPAFVAASGTMGTHKWTDHLQAAGDNGHASHINKWIRFQPATWISGMAISTTGSGTTVVNIGASSGSMFQLHEHNTEEHMSPASLYVYNDETTPRLAITNLSDIVTDSLGNSINNKYFSIVVWYTHSEMPGDSKLLINKPSGSYSSESDARADADKLTDFSIPSEYRGNAVLLHRIILRNSSGTTTVFDGAGDDLRGSIPNTAAGSSTSVASQFLDSTFRVENVTDTTKLMALDVSGVTTGTTRTLTVQDKDITIAGLDDLTASNTSVVPVGNLASVTTQLALEELQGDIDTTNDALGASNLERADKYLASQDIAYMGYTDGNLTKIQYNNATDVEYEVLNYTTGTLTSIDHYIASTLEGTSTLSYTSGALISVIFVGV